MVNNFQVAKSFSNRNLELIILPTEKCNFRCTYCYEDFEQGRMSETVINAIELLIFKRISTLDFLKISWFGGEPLLAEDIIKRINSYALRIIEQNNLDVKFNSGITTNGYYLNLPLATELTKLKVFDYQISIDGSKEFHDKTRLKANGKGTFDKVWENLLNLRKSDLNFEILIRLHITEENYHSCFDFIKVIESEFLNDKRFSLIVKAIGKYGGKNDYKINPLTNQHEVELNNTIKKYKEVISGSQPYICYASKPNSFVIRSDGKINKCTVALKDSINCIGELQANGELKILPSIAKKWSAGFFNNDEEYLACPMSKIYLTP